mgnify:CR=1 FL=1
MFNYLPLLFSDAAQILAELIDTYSRVFFLCNIAASSGMDEHYECCGFFCSVFYHTIVHVAIFLVHLKSRRRKASNIDISNTLWFVP